jgi:hypothetical protein
MNDNEYQEVVEDRIRTEMRHIGHSIGSAIDAAGGGYGFVLIIFERKAEKPRVNFVANAERETIVTLMKDFIEQAEHDFDRPPPPRQM